MTYRIATTPNCRCALALRLCPAGNEPNQLTACVQAHQLLHANIFCFYNQLLLVNLSSDRSNQWCITGQLHVWCTTGVDNMPVTQAMHHAICNFPLWTSIVNHLCEWSILSYVWCSYANSLHPHCQQVECSLASAVLILKQAGSYWSGVHTAKQSKTPDKSILSDDELCFYDCIHTGMCQDIEPLHGSELWSYGAWCIWGWSLSAANSERL